MHKAVLTSLVGLMLLASGSANALTFKSDGKVVQSGYEHLSSKPSLSLKAQPSVSYEFVCSFPNGSANFRLSGNILTGSFGYQSVDFDLASLEGARTAGLQKDELGAWRSNMFPFWGESEINLGKQYTSKWSNLGDFQTRIIYILTGFSKNAESLVVVNADVRTELKNKSSGLHEFVDGTAEIQVASGMVISTSFENNRYGNIDHTCALQGEEKLQPQTISFLKEKFGLKLENFEMNDLEVASSTNTQDNTPTSTELLAAQRKAEELEKRLADLEVQQQQQQQTISSDTKVPLITITQSGTDQRKGIIRGFARDNVQIAEVVIDGNAVTVGSDGSFEWTGFVPATGKDIVVEAIDTAALSSSKIIRLERGQIQQASGPRFDDLDPTAGKRVVKNDNALALIVGISDYERTDAPAIYADKDAQYFHDYASLKLGIPDSNITTMINEKAEQGDVYLAVADWLRRSLKPGKSDVYIFFAGHGLASQDGEQMYLLPYDGRPRLLDKTAILREELFDDIAAANPRSVTVFLDTCYSGTTRGPEMLVASRPIAIRAKESAIPEGFTVMTAAAGNQTAKPLEEAKHGMFSYFLMKGMEGDADANSDNQITAGELHAYVKQNVIQQSSGSQTPELQGDADRVLVRFQ